MITHSKPKSFFWALFLITYFTNLEVVIWYVDIAYQAKNNSSNQRIQYSTIVWLQKTYVEIT